MNIEEAVKDFASQGYIVIDSVLTEEEISLLELVRRSAEDMRQFVILDHWLLKMIHIN
jgi:hypothetical protein